MNCRAREWIPITLLTCALAGAGLIERPTPTQEMARAAGAFIESLSPELRAKAVLAFDNPAREDWHYIPREHAGVAFEELNGAQKIAARRLLRTALSSRGSNKVEEIMQLESVLREIEKNPRRDPLAYSVAVFGTPGVEPWGWKFEGHHVSLNFTGAHGGHASTPAFLGANPAEVREGDRAGVRVLGAEEDIARELLATLTEAQRHDAIIADAAPADILAVPGRSIEQVDASGVLVSSMSAPQREIVQRLLREYAENLRHELASDELARIESAGIEHVRFAWMGGVKPGEGHYYRLSGPTFVIEYDNTQNGANHAHTVWRDRTRDFAHDLLKEHIEHDHHAK